MKPLHGLILLTSLFSSFNLFADPNIVGTWRSIDDKTGFSKAIIEIKQDDKGLYQGKIIGVTPRPGYTAQTVCSKCKGADKNKPIIGLQLLRNMKQSPTNPLEYSGGTILDPLSGNNYKSTIRLNSTGSRLSIRGFVGIEVIGRNQTWLRHD